MSSSYPLRESVKETSRFWDRELEKGLIGDFVDIRAIKEGCFEEELFKLKLQLNLKSGEDTEHFTGGGVSSSLRKLHAQMS